MTYKYERWETPEEVEFAWARVNNGEWDFERFRDWLEQVLLIETRDAYNDGWEAGQNQSY